MPYKIVKSGSKYKVMKKSGSSHIFGTHPSKKAAQKQIAAIHANESTGQPKLTFNQFVESVLANFNKE
ncbi:hypothetical protein EBZ39_00785 [bacterium]|nr:hypothetical protein [bacterium]